MRSCTQSRPQGAVDARSRSERVRRDDQHLAAVDDRDRAFERSLDTHPSRLERETADVGAEDAHARGDQLELLGRGRCGAGDAR